jgi:hypothetical protein
MDTTPRGGHPHLERLPVWPTKTIAVLTTIDPVPHAIPFSAPVRAGDRRILLNLKHGRGSLARLRDRPQVALLILAAGDLAFSARGTARVVEEPMEGAPDYAAIEIEVESIDDHRQPEFLVESGVHWRWADGQEQRALGARVEALRDLAAQE